MFRKIVESLEKVNSRSAYRKGTLSCPECGAKPGEMPANWEGVITCPSCGVKASLTEWSSKGESGRRTGQADRPPVGTSIRRESISDGAAVWNIPAKGKFGFFMFFAIMWLGIIILVSGVFLFTILSGGKIEGDMPKWALIPFFGIFYAVGFGMLYAGLREKFMRHRLSVGGGKVTLGKQLFGRLKEKSISSNALTSVSQKEFYQKNYQPVYGIEIKGSEGKLRFGSALSEDEKAWLVADIAKTIKTADSTGYHAVDGESESGIGTIKVAKPRSVFSIPIPGPGKTTIIACLIFAAVGIGFFCVGLFVMEGEPMPARSGGDGAGHWFELGFALLGNGFRTFWLLLTGFFAALGIGMTIGTSMKRGKDRRIEGDETEISVRTYRRGLVIGDNPFPRSEVTDIRASESGSSNGRPMKRVELIVGERAEKIASWMDGDEADALVADVREALGVRHHALL